MAGHLLQCAPERNSLKFNSATRVHVTKTQLNSEPLCVCVEVGVVYRFSAVFTDASGHSDQSLLLLLLLLLLTTTVEMLVPVFLREAPLLAGLRPPHRLPDAIYHTRKQNATLR